MAPTIGKKRARKCPSAALIELCVLLVLNCDDALPSGDWVDLFKKLSWVGGREEHPGYSHDA